MTIGELSQRCGVAASAIRYYEEEGLLPLAMRRAGKRVFGDEAVARLTVIHVAKQAGFSLAEIRQLVRGFGGERWRTLAARKLAEIDQIAARLEVMRELLQRLVRCGCFDIDECGRALRRHCVE